ncbi:MAG: S24 family peptidase [Planctomycetota bacterium]
MQQDGPVGEEEPLGVVEGETLGAVIRARRSALRLSLAEVGDRVACAKSYLSLIETGRKGPPSDDIIERLEGALSLPAGRLVRLAALERTPEPVRRDLERFESDRRRLRELRRLVERGGLDEAFRTGSLARLIGDQVREASGAGAGEANAAVVALPLEVPVINAVAAGYPRDFTDLGYPAGVADDYVRCPDIDDADAFAARVVGDSMAPEYREGDIVIFSPAREIESGSDCFARLEPDHETTFKRVYFERDGAGAEVIRLQPINNAFAPRVLPREEVAGLYRAVRVLRKLA